MSESQPDGRTKVRRSKSQRSRGSQKSSRSQRSRQSLGPIASDDDLESPFVTDDDMEDEDAGLAMTGRSGGRKGAAEANPNVLASGGARNRPSDQVRSGDADQPGEEVSKQDWPPREARFDPPAREVHSVPPPADEQEEGEEVVPGTEVLHDDYWHESSSGASSSGSSSSDGDDDSSFSSSASTSSSASESESSDSDDDEESEDESASGVEVVEEGRGAPPVSAKTMVLPIEDPRHFDDDGEDGGDEEENDNDKEVKDKRAETDDDAYPVVMGSLFPPPRDPPAEEIATSSKSGAAKTFDADDKQGEHTDTTATTLEPFDLEAQDATFGEDVEEGNLEDFAGGNAKDNELREAPTTSFSQDSAEADERFLKENDRTQRKRTMIAVLGAVVVLAVVAGVVGGVVGSRSGGSPSPSPTPPNATQPPEPSINNSTPIANQSLFQMVANASADGGEAIKRAGTPQSEAYLSLEGEASEYGPTRWLQRYALRTMYYSTNGPSGWINQSGWESDADECLWYQTKVDGTVQSANSPGTVCGQDHVLHSLILVGNNVTGSLPPELSMLSGLTRFYVETPLGSSQGSLTGGIPSTLASLTRLEEFSLRNHLLDQPLPAGLFDGWSAARLVEIADCHVPGNFPDISRLAVARNLNFGINRFQGSFPAEDLSRLSQLKIFIVDGNELTGTLPSGNSTLYSALSRMIVLSVAKNRLGGTIPSQLGSLVNLKQRLDLSFNAFNGPIPTEINRLSNLERLLLDHNQLVGAVPDLSGLTNLKELSLEGNRLRGEISNGTCVMLSANGADASADCAPNTGNRPLVVCSCCNTCCDPRANATCVAV
jgi:hypothetical protein